MLKQIKEFEVGDIVYDIRFGEGKVVSINNNLHYPITVEFIKVNHDYDERGFSIKSDINPSLFRYKYWENKFEERVVEVSHREDFSDSVLRVMFYEKNGYAICWRNCGTVEEAKDETRLITFPYWREIQTPKTDKLVHLTLKDISEGKGVGVDPKLIRIKE